MTIAQSVALLLALAVPIAWTRLLLAYRRAAHRPHAWRLLLLLVLQPLLAGALFLVLFPPSHPVAAGVLTVLTEGATRADAPAAGEGGVLLALPEAREAGDVARVPDLATALRRHPGTARVHVVGAGLVARDREAARALSISFDPPPLPLGVVQLSPPREVAQGAGFALDGRVEGVPGGRVELLDPAGRRIDAMPLADDGRFALRGIAFAPGAAAFAVRVLDPDGKPVDQAQVPVWIEAAVAPRVLLLAGAPNPETRALRRWLEDAGAQVQARISLGGGLQLGGVALTGEALADADLLVADARAWSALGEGGRTRAFDAVRAGMGLLLRADTPLPAASLRGLHTPRFAIDGGAGTQPWAPSAARVNDEDALRGRIGIGRGDAPFDLAQAEEGLPPLARRAWRVRGADALPLVPGASDVPAGWWRAEGRGRVGVWTLLDSYALPLHGRPDLYGELWSPALATLARARANTLPPVDAGARVDQRLVICGLPEAATIEAPGGGRTVPIVDPASGQRRCAGFWPQSAGWHRLRSGDAARPFHVAAEDDDPGQRLAELREATLRLVAAVPAAATGAPSPAVPGRAWPWFLAWLLLAAFAWWLERSRLGLPVVASRQDRRAGMR